MSAVTTATTPSWAEDSAVTTATPALWAEDIKRSHYISFLKACESSLGKRVFQTLTEGHTCAIEPHFSAMSVDSDDAPMGAQRICDSEMHQSNCCKTWLKTAQCIRAVCGARN